MAPYKVGAMPKYLKTNGEVKKLENDWGDNEVKASALRDIIKKKTDGRVEVTDSINNENSLLGILRSYMRMKNYGNGNLVPDNVRVYDPEPDRVVVLGRTIGGEYFHEGGTKNSPDLIAIPDTSLNAGRPPELDTREDRFHPIKDNNKEYIVTHELAHAAQEAHDGMKNRYVQRALDDAEKYKDKYSADDIMKYSLSQLKYTIPKLFDTVFGTHIVPTYEEWGNMTDENAAAFWKDNFKSLDDGYSYETVFTKKFNELGDKLSPFDWSASDEYKELESDRGHSLFEKAARNAGFNSVDEANRSISRYADASWAEAFAEAYSDVLLNGDKATPYSQELIRLYSEAADKWSKKFRSDEMPMQVDMFKKLMDVSPLKDTLSIKKKGAK